MKRLLAAMAATMLAGSVPAETQPLSRYQSIIDRQMFGRPPNGFDPNQNPNEVKSGKGSEKNLTEEQEKLQHSVRFSMINITPSGETAVGFTDNTDGKNPVHYYLKVGEKRNGWEVKEADPVRAWMRLAKGEVEVELELGGTSGGASGADKKKELAAGAATPAMAPKPTPTTTSTMPAETRNTLLAGGKSLRERKAQRAAQEEERKRRQEEDRARQEEEREELRNDFMAMREEMRMQREEREEREEAFFEMERRREADMRELDRLREADERRRREEESKEPDNQSEEVKE